MKKAFVILILSLIMVGCSTKEKKEETEKVVVPKEPVIENHSFSFIGAGDALIHVGVYNDAKTNEKGEDGYYIYDFKNMFTYIKDVIAPYDLKFYNQETIIGGKNLGLSNYPLFNSPDEIGNDLIETGFNIVNLATNHTMDKRKEGAIYSANFWHSKENVLAVGSYISEERRNTPEIKEINGITYAMLSYTYGTNGMPVYEGYEYLVNVWPMLNDVDYQLYKDQVKKDVESIRDKVDILMVSMHWGNEYTHVPNSYQKDAAAYLASLGVDVIVGTHPHVVQPIEFIEDTLVIYSLGNMVSAQEETSTRVGLMAAFTVNKETTDGATTKLEITDVKGDLIWTYHQNYKNFKVIPFKFLNNDLLPNYEKIYEQYKEYINPNNDQRITIGI